MSSPSVSVIIINYRSAQFTRACLQSIFANCDRSRLEVIVIDNASYDGCDQIVRTDFPSVVFIQSERNLGFAGGNNLGISAAHGQYLLFLNPDTEIEENAISRLMSSLASIPDAGMVGARLLNSDRSLQTSSITAFPSVANQLLGSEFLRRRFPRAKLWGIQALFSGGLAPVAVDAISGACMMAHAELIRDVQGFTADYFMYSEDLDLCLKIQTKGRKVYYVPDAVVLHHGGQSSATRPESAYAAVMIRESLCQFMRKHRGPYYASVFRATTAAAAILRVIFITILLPLAATPSFRSVLPRMWRKWSEIVIWSLGFRPWVRHGVSALSPVPVIGADRP